MSQIAIIIPTRRRAHLLPGLVESIRANTTAAYTIHLTVEREDVDTRAAAEKLIVNAIIGEYGSHVASANAGVRATGEPLFVVANDDVIFHPGWDVRALERMVPPIKVVGINQGNGVTTCFSLVDRSYITEHGGEFYYPGYLSQFCDTEVADLARARGVWADAPDALIEHCHWTLGKAEIDENYQQAIDSVAHDRQVYADRSHLWAA